MQLAQFEYEYPNIPIVHTNILSYVCKVCYMYICLHFMLFDYVSMNDNENKPFYMHVAIISL